MFSANQIEILKNLAGVTDPAQVRNIDCFLFDKLSIFIPSVGPCYYSISPEHAHPGYMFIIPYDDNSSIMYKGRLIKYDINRLCAISPRVLHQEVTSDLLSRYICIVIEENFYNTIVSKYTDDKVCYEVQFYDVPDDLVVTLKSFMNEVDSDNLAQKDLLGAISVQIAHKIARLIHRPEKRDRKLDMRLEINKVIEFIQSKYMTDVSVKDMAEHVFMSKSHFTKVFKDETGNSPTEYLNIIRLDKAKKMIRAGDKSISMIASDCGFGTVSYFSTVFQKKFGVSPSMYKKNL